MNGPRSPDSSASGGVLPVSVFGITALATSENTQMKTSNINAPTESNSRFGHVVIEMLTRTVIILSATLTFAAVAAVA
jgi:hypothetical protein